MCVSSCVWMCDLLVDSGKSECCHSGRKEERGVRGFWELVLRYIIFPLGQAGTGCELGGLAGGIWLQCTRIHIRTNLTISERNQDTNVNMCVTTSSDHLLTLWDRLSLWLFRKTHEIWVYAASGAAEVINFTVLFLWAFRLLTFFLIVCSLTALFVYLTFHSELSVIFLQNRPGRLFFTGCMIFFFFFFSLRELWKAWCLLLSAGFLFTPLCPDSLQTLQFTLCGKQDRTLCVGFPSSWHGYRPPTKPDDNARQPQQTQPTKLHTSKPSVQNIWNTLIQRLISYRSICVITKQRGTCSLIFLRY